MPRDTPNLNLRVWNSLNDLYNHSELADNWDKVDAHDHSTNPVGASGLSVDSVVAEKIEDGAVVRTKLASGAVGTGQVETGAITNGKLANSAVNSRTLKPTVGIASASSTLTLTTTSQAVSGGTVTITPEVASYVIVNTIFNFKITGGSPGTCTGTLKVGNTTQNASARFATSTGDGTATVGQTYYISVGASATTIAIWAEKVSGSSTCTAEVGTAFTYLVVAA